ncbi:MAG: hypothetical protein U0930_17035 [Pirellulales bacterium]
MIRSIYEFCFAERGIGIPSRARVLFDWLTLGPMRRAFMRLGFRALLFETPEWAKQAQSRVLVGSFRKISLFDWVNPIRWLVWICIFFVEWIATRRFYSYGPTIPAVTITVLMISCLGLAAMKRDHWREAMYQQELRESLKNKDNEQTSIALARLLERSPERVDLRIQKALLHDQLAEQTEARMEMENLLLLHRSPIAAYWIIQKDFRLNNLREWEEKKHLAFRELIQVCATRDNLQVYVASRILFGQYLLGIGASSEAVAHMESVADENPELQLVCAVIHSQLRNEAATTLWASKAQDGYRKLLLANPNDDGARLSLARAMMLQGQFESVVRTLNDGYRLTKNQSLLTASSEALVSWAQRLEKQDPSEATLAKRLNLLSQANELAPSSRLVVESLVATIIKCADSQDPEIEKMRTAIIGTLSTEKSHFVQGTVAILRGQMDQAEEHLRLAMTETNNVPGVFNNLAVALSQQEDPDLTRALSLVDTALKSVPNQPQIRETRGQILVKMKQYKDAIQDLEFALSAKVEPKPIHESLAVAYEAIGLTDLANTHRKMAEQK